MITLYERTTSESPMAARWKCVAMCRIPMDTEFIWIGEGRTIDLCQLVIPLTMVY